MIYFVIGVLVLGLVMLWLVFRSSRKKYGLSDAAKQQVRMAWEQIEGLATSDDESAHTRAVLEADKLLDYAMRERGIPGETLGDRLKNGKQFFKDIDSVWRAHKVRNQLAHEMNMKLSSGQARQVLDLFKRALNDLGAL